MATYLWTAKTRLGETRSGEMDAPNKAVVHQKLQSQDLKIVKLKRKPLEINIELFEQPITARDLMIFYPAVLDDDRCRSADGSVLGYPWQPG